MSTVVDKVVGRAAMAKTSSQQDMLFNTSPRYSITERCSVVDVGSRSGLVGKSKVRRGSFKSANGALFSGITSNYGRNGFGQRSTDFVSTGH